MRFRRVLKIALLSAAALAAAGALAGWIVIDRAASAPGLKPRIEKAASDFLGRPMTIDALEWRGWPSTTLVGRNVRLYEDPQKRLILVDAPAVEARLALLSIFKLAAGITELRFLSPRVNLRRDKDGVWNAGRLVDEISARPDEPAARWGSVAFNWFVIEGGTLTVEDEAGPLGALSPLDVRGSGKLRFGRRRVHFPFELTGRLPGSAASFLLAGDVGGRARLRLDVKDAKPSLARLTWAPAESWSGRWDGTLQYDERVSTRWRLHARAAPLSVSTAAPTIGSLELTAVYDSSANATFSAAALSSTTEIDARGSMKNGALALDLKSPKADLDELWAFARAVPLPSAEPPRADASPSGSMIATVSAQDLRYADTDFRDVRAVIRRTTGPYVLDGLTLRSLGGTIAARGSYRPAPGDGSVEFVWTASSVSIQDLFRLAGSTLQAGGIVDTEGSLQTRLGARALRAMNGTVKFDVRKGWFENMPGLLKVLSRLNITTLIAEVRGRSRARVHFAETRGEVKITNGSIQAGAPIVLQNKTLQLAFLGTYDLPSRTVDGRLMVNFLTVTDEIIGMIPGVREILLGKEKGLLPIWVKLSGDAADPRIEILSVRTISTSVWNTMKNVVFLPKTLFDEIKPSKR